MKDSAITIYLMRIGCTGTQNKEEKGCKKLKYVFYPNPFMARM